MRLGRQAHRRQGRGRDPNRDSHDMASLHRPLGAFGKSGASGTRSADPQQRKRRRRFLPSMRAATTSAKQRSNRCCSCRDCLPFADKPCSPQRHSAPRRAGWSFCSNATTWKCARSTATRLDEQTGRVEILAIEPEKIRLTGRSATRALSLPAWRVWRRTRAG